MALSSAPVNFPILARRSKAAGLSLPQWAQILGFFALHAPLAFVMKAMPALGALHALASLGLGLFFAFFDKTPRRAVQAAAYIVGAETLWRMSNAPIFYEFGKYATCLVLIVSLVNHLDLKRLPIVPLIYIALLVPSTFLTEDRELISYNLSGPFMLAVATIYFSRIQFTEPGLQRLLLTIVAPIVGVATLASFSTVTAPDIDFSKSQTLKVTAGGLLPLHVANVLALGVVVVFLYLWHRRPDRTLAVGLIGLAIWFCAQSALTFARGGLFIAAATIAVATFHALGVRRVRVRLIGTAIVAGSLALILVIPWLQNFTEGAFGQRFTDTYSSGRDRLARADLAAFFENPVLGVGPGESMNYRRKFYGKRAQAHTEYTRLPAEHGIFGVAALVALGVMCWPRFFRRGYASSKVYSAALTTWPLLFMAYNGTRFAAVGFLFGLAAAGILTKRDILLHTLTQYRRELTFSHLERTENFVTAQKRA